MQRRQFRTQVEQRLDLWINRHDTSSCFVVPAGPGCGHMSMNAVASRFKSQECSPMAPPPPFGANSAAARDVANVLHPYTDLKTHQQVGPVVISRGKGIRVWDEAGKDYIESVA